jgi:hypothetical protein
MSEEDCHLERQTKKWVPDTQSGFFFFFFFWLWVIDWHVTLCRYVSVSGFHGVVAGFLVAVKQIMPDQEVPFLLKLRAKVKKASSIYVTSHCSDG